MHASDDTRLVRCFDGIAMSYWMIEHTYREVEKLPAMLKDNKKNIHRAFWLCWSFVDAVHRIRELTQAIPGLGSKKPQVRAFLYSTSVVEYFRNYVQHLRQELTKLPGNTFPVWGTLAWVDPDDELLCHIALAGTLVGQMNYPGCVYDTVDRKWASKVTLSVGNKSINFDTIFTACLQFNNFIVPWLNSKYSPGIQVIDDLPVQSVRIEFPNGGDTDSGTDGRS